MWPWILLGVFLAVIFLFGGCMVLVGGAVKSVSDASSTVRSVTYQAESSGRPITVFYDTSTSQGVSNASASGVGSGWSKTVQHAGLLGPNLTVSLDPELSRTTQRVGTVTCRILIGGTVVKESSSSGEFASASCFATPQELGKSTDK